MGTDTKHGLLNRMTVLRFPVRILEKTRTGGICVTLDSKAEAMVPMPRWVLEVLRNKMRSNAWIYCNWHGRWRRAIVTLIGDRGTHGHVNLRLTSRRGPLVLTPHHLACLSGNHEPTIEKGKRMYLSGPAGGYTVNTCARCKCLYNDGPKVEAHQQRIGNGETREGQ